MLNNKRLGRAGYTLVELMIVVAIVGTMAALAVYGVNKYLASSKTAEAKNTIGSITQGAVAAFERETNPNQLINPGQVQGAATNVLCISSANRVPLTTPAGKKYQPSTVSGADFNTGNATTGWKCLHIDLNQPIYFSYGYVTGTGTGLSGATAAGFEANAFGDLNGNGGGAVTPGPSVSTFARGADVRNGKIVLSTEIFIQNPTE